MDLRTENDFLGEAELPAGALHGIHTLRAMENFPDRSLFSQSWYQAIGIVKKACYHTIDLLGKAAREKYPETDFTRQLPEPKVIEALIKASDEVSAGMHFAHFLVPAISGGAGTSINMNINEIIANRALEIIGDKPGNYEQIDPTGHANLFQSTNDVIPTSLKLAAMFELEKLELAINSLRFVIEQKEGEFRDVMRTGYTQMQSAVPSSYGLLLSNYSDALSRDWWRISKCFERIKVVNLGGGATGTGMAIPRFFIMEVVPALRKLTGLPVTRSENMSDTTSNLDALVEVHAVVKSLAVNLEKISGDLRLLASDLTSGELHLPHKQVGSSIMPGKVNPVIPEYVISVAHRVYANDQVVTTLSAQGCLELNAYLPVIGDALLNSLQLLTGACATMKSNLFEGLEVDSDTATEQLYRNSSITTALVPIIGYHKATLLARLMKEAGCSVFEANDKLKLIDKNKLEAALAPKELLKLGFSLKEL
ncbi:MAG: lyase family protein [Bacteroidales bacterium]